MFGSHTVLLLHHSLRRIRKEVYLPWITIKREWTLNELWKENGKYGTDVYADGDVSWLSVRQARAHGLIFVGPRNARFLLKDTEVGPDVVVDPAAKAKEIETQIGRERLRLRRAFGVILRDYAWTRAVHFHGSEVESITHGPHGGRRFYGYPPRAPLAYPSVDCELVGDGPVDEKLVSMLDYAVHGFDNVIYVGSGDGRTLRLFRKKDRRRFASVSWILIDPIAQPIEDVDNVVVMQETIDAPRDLRRFHRDGTTLLLWDVRSDRCDLDDTAWEQVCLREDELGEDVASGNGDWLDAALLKRRIPFTGTFKCLTSILCYQPGAPEDMYELRSFLAFNSRRWLGTPSLVTLIADGIRRRIPIYHGRDRGRLLRTRLIQTLHVEPADALTHTSAPRADLFYLTNRRNPPEKVFDVVARSEISTLWVGDPLLSYDDYSMERTEIMLRCSSDSHMVTDGLGFVLLLMLEGEVKNTVKFDPGWACNYAVVFRRRAVAAVPDVWLCRFIGLRANSSSLRLREPISHATSDLIKSLGIDLSGHLYVTLVTGRYLSDLRTWFRMILDWSSKGREEKMLALASARAEVIEWKDEMEDKPWHRKEDLIAALNAFRSMAREALHPYVDAVVEHLRYLGPGYASP
uniref:Core protein VP4 n=1 Tax=Kemerovo virus TaxID=40064 RepID=A0A5S9EDK4_9REOV|nr:capping protein VP4 [Kemerovo virus]